MSKFFGWLKKDKGTPAPQEQDNASTGDVSDIAEHNHDVDCDTADEHSSAAPSQRSDTEAVSHNKDSDNESMTTAADDASTPDKPTSELVCDTDTPVNEERISETVIDDETENSELTQSEPSKKGFFARLKTGLSRTRENIGTGFISLFRGKKIDDELYEELETQLLVADVGMDTTQRIIDKLTESAKLSQLKDGDALYEMLKTQMSQMLQAVSCPLDIPPQEGPFVILMVGVNGVGKTTTIGKMAKQFQLGGKKVMLAAGDTFRAAAVEQLQVWGERNDIPVIAQQTGSDSASVLFDAVESAKAKNIDILIADTAGRLQNKDNLMEELKKVVRVMKKLDPSAPHEIMLTLDAATGQNAVSQAKLFNDAVGLTGLTLTKLDGTAKGGIIFALADQFSIPIRYIGVGEGIDDLRSFDSEEFVDALFSEAK